LDLARQLKSACELGIGRVVVVPREFCVYWLTGELRTFSHDQVIGPSRLSSMSFAQLKASGIDFGQSAEVRGSVGITCT
jgi:hypothetical protein